MRLDVGNLKLFGLDLNAAFAWWRDGLRAAMPSWLLPSFVRPAPRLVALWDGQQVSLYQPGGVELARLETAALEVAADGVLQADIKALDVDTGLLQLELELSTEQVLLRRLDLPVIDPAKLREVVRWQLPRLTPFSADQLYYAAGVADDSAPYLLAIPRASVDPVIGHIERLTGLTVARLYREPATEETLPRLNLFGQSRVPGRWWRRLNRNTLILAVLLLALGMAAIAPVWVAREQVIARKQELFRVHAGVVGTMETRDQLTQRLEIINALQTERSLPPVSSLIAELAERVPDSIFLTEVRVQGETLKISGSGLEVVNLIDRLNASPLFVDARFNSSVNRNSRTGRDQFTASLQVVPRQEGEQ
ncbi:PilN domain-containing protein [Halopseudomonas salegens]|uniref:General secretion pathway protein L n=1 Tax=Halopseudomonas salegens TaxID=1434072 RepID=A0A1H2HWA0_9GAMM|nr:PilN domain-containing protein [Halopseudomonas salegens]SDU36161.1 general secretion pathway protein L [Halopseudomonas salegens]